VKRVIHNVTIIIEYASDVEFNDGTVIWKTPYVVGESQLSGQHPWLELTPPKDAL
jgi:hypothetical protein